MVLDTDIIIDFLRERQATVKTISKLLNVKIIPTIIIINIFELTWG